MCRSPLSAVEPAPAGGRRARVPIAAGALAIYLDESWSFALPAVHFSKTIGSEQEENGMAFRPLHDRVAVRRLESEEKGRDETGKLTPLDVKAGDKVLFGK